MCFCPLQCFRDLIAQKHSFVFVLLCVKLLPVKLKLEYLLLKM